MAGYLKIPCVVPINFGYQFHNYKGINSQVAYVLPEHLARDYTSRQLRSLSIKLGNRDLGSDFSKLDHAKVIWQSIKNGGTKMSDQTGKEEKAPAKGADAKTPKAPKAPKAPNKYTFTLKDPASWAKAANQVKVIMGELHANKGINKNGTAEVDEAQLIVLLDKMVTDGKLITKQPAIRVFKYYIPKLRDEFKVLACS